MTNAELNLIQGPVVKALVIPFLIAASELRKDHPSRTILLSLDDLDALLVKIQIISSGVQMSADRTVPRRGR
jgi:hypothetical protein